MGMTASFVLKNFQNAKTAAPTAKPYFGFLNNGFSNLNCWVNLKRDGLLNWEELKTNRGFVNATNFSLISSFVTQRGNANV